tara:strand:- start:442 stop:867 length:426 start_codon:yes stop_codon:yes gene_type:complete
MISDWLEQNRNPKIDMQVEKELEFLSKQRLEKYSERFDNNESEIGNPDTWGKRVVEEAAEKYSEPYRCPATNENEYCKHDIISAFNNGAKWQQERMYSEKEVKRLAFDFYYDMSHKMGVPTNLISENATNVDVWFKQFKNK